MEWSDVRIFLAVARAGTSEVRRNPRIEPPDRKWNGLPEGRTQASFQPARPIPRYVPCTPEVGKN